MLFLLKIKKMAYKKVIEMLGENLASFLELAKKWLVDWSVDTKKLLHFFHNIKKEDLAGLLNGTHQITKVEVLLGEKISFNVWKTIKLGNYKNADEFRKALKKNGFKIGDWANDILSKPAFTVAGASEEIQLVNVSVADLGFKNGATYKDICTKAKELGLELCPNEVGPQLRLQYKDQPKGEWLRIAMEPIIDSGGHLGIFNIVHYDGDLWLLGDYGDSVRFWNADYCFVFRLRK